MFDIYLNDRRDLLVVRKGFPIPVGGTSGRWRKRKRKVLCVSDEIRLAVQNRGYYLRNLKDMKKRQARLNASTLGDGAQQAATAE